ncbi:hypothetical protein [Staphylococcus simulans]|uniref:hypothetical protein n=1 Tax=Staphylococcus simulans TaxID=1286 RepID=UPI0021D0181D|nr:hypothetical protein [Staphylococcus simulans]UXV37755.1 hypothetical protein MUA87_01060 [Staphylococcus simulans]UXV40203.1 hypothetical protein MUA56_01060 [Staphylococcus simulans]
MEDKHDKFVRLAEQRTNGAINKIRLLSNLANTNNYAYEKSEVKEIFRAIEKELKIAEKAFEKEFNNKKEFQFKRKR